MIHRVTVAHTICLQFQNLCDMCFVVFAIAFGITRIVIFPLWILKGIAFRATLVTINYMGAHVFYLVLLGALQVLHIFWFQTIVRMVCQTLRQSQNPS